MIRETIAVGLLGCNCTVLGDEPSREAIVIDPGANLPTILAVIEKHRLIVKRIVITHAHFDHVAAAMQLKQLTGAPIFYNQADLPLAAMVAEQPRWVGLPSTDARLAEPDHSPADGEVVSVEGITAHILHTPGHTPGSLCLYLPGQALLLAGDTLFAGGVGRTDFPLGDPRALTASIRSKLLPLPDDTLVIPGHGPATTIGDERATNPFL